MATYKLIGQRFLRRYTAAEPTPVYASAVEAWKQSLDVAYDLFMGLN